MLQEDQQGQDYDRRPGTNLTHGPNFEHQMMAYVAVTCCNKKDIKEWWMASNVEGTGAFDDIVLFIEREDSRPQLYLIQLKHKENPKNKNQDEIKEPTEIKAPKKNKKKKRKKKKKKDPLIIKVKDKKYFESFQQITKLMSNADPQPSCKLTTSLFNTTGVKVENMQFVFITNNELRAAIKPLEEVTNSEINILPKQLNKVPNTFFFATNSVGQVYQLNPIQTENTDEKQFRSQFYIIAEQISANSDDLLKKIESELKTYFNSNSNFNEYFNVAKELTDEIEEWFKNCSKKLTFQVLKEIISKLILAKFVQKRVPDRNYNKLEDCEFIIWKQISAPFQLVVFDNENSEMENFLQASNSHLFIKCENNCIDVVIKCLAIGKQNRVVMKKSINSLQPFQHILNKYKIDSFKCLSNLSEKLIDMLGECSLLLQGKPLSLKSLLSLNPSLAKVFDVDDVINLISNKLYIGDDLKPLSNYVSRSITRLFLKKTVIVEKPNSYFIIIVETNCYQECVAKIQNVIKHVYTQSAIETKEVNFQFVKNNGVNQAMLNANERYKSVHVLAFHEYKSKILFEWVTSTNNVSEIESFIDKEIHEIPSIGENEIDLVLNYSKKVVILGNPGMGKSFYLRSLFNKYSTDSWILFVTLNELVNAKTNNFQACLDYCVSKINKKSRQIFDVYLERKSVVVLFDGFDEIAPYYENEGLKIIKGASELGLKIVVMSRFVKGNDLEEKFETLSRTMQPFTEENKSEFLINYYSKEVANMNNSNRSDLFEKVTLFVDQLLRNISLSSWDSNFTGVPLQCWLIAESFVDEFFKYCKTGILKLPEKLNLLSLYERFIDKKYNILWKEKGKKIEVTATDIILQKPQKGLFTQNHMAAAVHIIFPSLDKKISDEYLKNIKDGEEKYGIITGVDSNNNPVFIHRTIAEYFAAKWLVDIKKAGSEEERTKYLKNLLSPEYNVVRDLFDRLVCSDCELHTAVLNADKEEVLRLWERDGRREQRKCGRSILHILSARGARHAWGEETAWINREYKTIKKIIRTEEESHLDVLDVLLSSSVGDAGKDQVLGWTAQQYAEDRKAFGVIDALIKHNQFNRSESVLLPGGKRNRSVNMMLGVEENIFQDEDKLLEMCFKYDYVNLAAKVVDLKSVERKKVEYWLMRCAEQDSVQCAKKMIESRGFTSRDLEEIKCKYEYDGCYQRRGGSLLHISAFCGSRAVLELLLGYFQVDIIDIEGRTALYYACNGGHLSTAQLLMSKGADPFAEDDDGEKPICYAIGGYNKELKELMSSFAVFKAAYGENVNALLGGFTALQWASSAGNLESAQQLVREGAQLNITNGCGRTPLHSACDVGNVQFVQILLQAGAELDVQDNEGRTALHVAAWRGKKEVLEELVRSGANTDILDNYQRSALTFARVWKETFLYLWPCTSHHTARDIRYYKKLTDGEGEEEIIK